LIELPSSAAGETAEITNELLRHYEAVPMWRETLTNLDAADAHDLLTLIRPGMNLHMSTKIFERFGGNPHCLNSIVRLLPADEAGIILPEPKECSDVLDRLISAAEGGIMRDFVLCAIAVDLLGGSFNRAEFRALQAQHDFTTATESLIRTTLFRRSAEGGVEYDHALAKDKLSERYRDHALRRTVAVRLLRVLSTSRIQRARLELLYAAKEWRSLIDEALRAASEAVETRDWTRAEQAFSLATSAADLTAAGATERLSHRVATHAADVRTYRYSLGIGRAPETSELRSLARAYTDDVFEGHPHRAELRPLGCVSLWRNAFYAEEFAEADKWAKTAVDAIEFGTPPLVAASAHIGFALTLHATGRRREAVQYLAGVRIDGIQYLIEAERLSIEAADELHENPVAAEKLYRAALEALEAGGGSTVHMARRRIDIAVALFARGDWASSEQTARAARDAAYENMLPVERGRATNVLAATQWVQGQKMDALSEWRRLFVEERGSDLSDWTSRRVEWRYLTNYATATAASTPAESASHARRAEELILSPRKNGLQTPQSRRSRWYAALLAVAAVYYQLGLRDRAIRLERTMGDQFTLDMIAIRDGVLPEGVAGTAAFRVCRTLMITG
jgi:hypothetical protein